jgi:hypothetical protein
MTTQIEVAETCLLLSPGYNKITNKFLIDTVAISPNYKVEGKPIVLWIDSKKYIEKIDGQCIPFCKIKCTVMLLDSQSVNLYANGDVYFCGIEYRKIFDGRL